jgi:hypothetical protein
MILVWGYTTLSMISMTGSYCPFRFWFTRLGRGAGGVA